MLHFPPWLLLFPHKIVILHTIQPQQGPALLIVMRYIKKSDMSLDHLFFHRKLAKNFTVIGRMIVHLLISSNHSLSCVIRVPQNTWLSWPQQEYVWSLVPILNCLVQSLRVHVLGGKSIGMIHVVWVIKVSFLSHASKDNLTHFLW